MLALLLLLIQSVFYYIRHKIGFHLHMLHLLFYHFDRLGIVMRSLGFESILREGFIEQILRF